MKFFIFLCLMALVIGDCISDKCSEQSESCRKDLSCKKSVADCTMEYLANMGIGDKGKTERAKTAYDLCLRKIPKAVPLNECRKLKCQSIGLTIY